MNKLKKNKTSQLVFGTYIFNDRFYSLILFFFVINFLAVI